MQISPQCNSAFYNSAVASHKGAIGFSSPRNHCSEKPQFLPARLAAFTVFGLPVLGGSDGRARALPVSRKWLPGLLTRPSRRPCLAAGAAVVANRNHLEAFNG